MDKTGNIRSVNVDYGEATERSRRREEFKGATNFLPTARGDSKRSSSLGSDKNSPQFAPLDAAILETVNELCDSRQSSGVCVSNLIEHLDTKYAHQINLPAVKYIDCAINGLLRSGKLSLCSLAHEQMESSLMSANQRARQSVFVDQLLVINEPTKTKRRAQANSRSTTLDSGIRSWDLGMSNSNSGGTQVSSSPQSTPTNRPSNHSKSNKTGALSLLRSLSFKGKQIPQLDKWQDSSAGAQFQEHQSRTQQKGTKLTGLFRSKSVRCVRSSQTMRHFKHQHLNQTSNQSATIDYLASATCKRENSILTRNNEHVRSGRIVLFLRKLFVARKTESKLERHSEKYQSTKISDYTQDYEKHEREQKEASSKEVFKAHTRQDHQVQATANQSLPASPFSSSADSSGSNSLIEILDCSPALNSSRRPLIEEKIESIGTPNRATKRLVKRSDSNLSQNSQASSSTTKSNVSQQLRRHLDEAYKRHRHCTSQRERDFIDSINVLRQASRHAIQQSVKSRQSNQRTRAKSSISELESQSSTLSSTSPSSNNNKSKNSSTQYREEVSQDIDLSIQEPTDCNLKLCTSDANGNLPTSTTTVASSMSNCYLCNSYLTSAKLCPLLSCPTSGFGACCLAQKVGERQQQHLLQMGLPKVDHSNRDSPEICCPLWNSMLYGYYSPLWSNQALPTLNGYQSMLEPIENLITSQNLIQQQQQQQLHQHQHNTTIDLKIEIGADFLHALHTPLVLAIHEHLCLEDDYTNDLPIFIEKRIICNYDTVPVHVYSIKITPDTDYETKLCLKGEFAETFNITKENELKLFGRLEQTETNLKLQIIRTANDIVGTPGERRQAINAIQFILIIEDCNQVSWQTIVVATLSSICVALMSTLAIMLILYQQKGLIRTGNDEDHLEEMPYDAAALQDETFINPRRTSSYEFSTLSKYPESTLERIETEKL